MYQCEVNKMSNYESYQCPFCGEHFPLIEYYTYLEKPAAFHPGKIEGEREKIYGAYGNPLITHMKGQEVTETIWLYFYHCPQCSRTALSIKSTGGTIQLSEQRIFPISDAKIFPDYIPAHIRQDYEEACKIVSLSPKASATLSRRCLQEMIRDFWRINNHFWSDHPNLCKELHIRDIGKPNLWQEIRAVEETCSIDELLIKVFKALKDLGNIGAHPTVSSSEMIDVNADEAIMMVQFIEILMERTYIKRENDNRTFSSIIKINHSKKDGQAF